MSTAADAVKAEAAAMATVALATSLTIAEERAAAGGGIEQRPNAGRWLPGGESGRKSAGVFIGMELGSKRLW